MTTHQTDLEIDRSYTIKEAAAAVGRAELTIRRRIEKGRFPGAELRPGSSGDEWRIPAEDLARVAQEDGWQIDLTDSQDQSEDESPSDLIAAVEARLRAESKIDLLNKDVQSLTDQLEIAERERDQARSDLEYTRTELTQLEEQLSEQTTATEVAVARAEELRERAEFAEKVSAQSAEERNSLDQKYHELEKQSAESLSAASAELETARTEHQTAVGERDEFADRLAKAEASMGWWTRRRYQQR